MKSLRGKDYGYPLMDLAETYVYHTAFPVEWERHASWEIHQVLSGVVGYEFDVNVSLELRGGTFLVIPPHMRHRTVNGSAAPSTRLATRWTPQKTGLRQGQSPLFLPQREIARIFTTLASTGLVVRQMPRNMLASAKALFKQVEQARPRPTALEAALLRHRCNDLLINFALTADEPEPILRSADVVLALQHYIDEHLDEKIQMGDLVKISGYGATQLSKLFRERLGLSPSRYLIRERIRRASAMLNKGTASITDIALACGFSSASYFSTVFHKYRGDAPSSERTAQRSHSHAAASSAW